MTDEIRCLSCDRPVDMAPRESCGFPEDHMFPRETYRGPEPRVEGWSWPSTIAFLGFLIFWGYIAWLVFG